MPYNMHVKLSNGKEFMAKNVYVHDIKEYPENSRISIIVDAKDYHEYTDILEIVGDGSPITSVEITEYKSIKVRGEYKTGEVVSTTTYDDYGVNMSINYNQSTDEYTIDLYKIDSVLKSEIEQNDRIMSTTLGILDTLEMSTWEGDLA